MCQLWCEFRKNASWEASLSAIVGQSENNEEKDVMVEPVLETTQVLKE